MENNTIIGFTTGDINGIGLEVFLKTIQDERILSRCIPVIFGSSKVVSYHRKAAGVPHINFNAISQVSEAKPGKLNILNAWEEEVKITLGEPNEVGGEYAIKSLEAATTALYAGEIQALITLPINKDVISKSGFEFPGHTEYIESKATDGEALMLMVNEHLKIGVVTGHIPLSEVSTNITKKKVLSRIKILNQTLKSDFRINKPKIAVLGLNPHAGDNGKLGGEENERIIPAIEEAKKQGIMALGPYSADGFFGSGNYKKFDGVLAMFHDQGLVPFKALSFGKGVNFTAGLPVIRTSPDHGTAYELAGKKEANPDSLRETLFTTLDIIKMRSEYSELTSNPLASSRLENDRNG
ncbi:MAG: 4-hydroxythreonine-4-phosphate dehydrogenase [Sphingobacteriales bacterium]|jgi:4-hydroxythreonine-4-phosphate dehydrogenase